jgi:hypothetical protein
MSLDVQPGMSDFFGTLLLRSFTGPDLAQRLALRPRPITLYESLPASQAGGSRFNASSPLQGLEDDVGGYTSEQPPWSVFQQQESAFDADILQRNTTSRSSQSGWTVVSESRDQPDGECMSMEPLRPSQATREGRSPPVTLDHRTEKGDARTMEAGARSDTTPVIVFAATDKPQPVKVNANQGRQPALQPAMPVEANLSRRAGLIRVELPSELRAVDKPTAPEPANQGLATARRSRPGSESVELKEASLLREPATTLAVEASPLLRPSRRAEPPLPLFVAPPQQSPPTIQVTIGRVEVRASQQAARQKSQERQRPLLMTLEEYLRQRDGGQK